MPSRLDGSRSIATRRQLRLGRASKGRRETTASPGVGRLSWGSSKTVQTVLLDLEEKGPTAQDKKVLYADVAKKLGGKLRLFCVAVFHRQSLRPT